jgi:hypothetical protein
VSSLRDYLVRIIAGVYFAWAHAGLLPPIPPARFDEKWSRAFQQHLCLITLTSLPSLPQAFPDAPQQLPLTDASELCACATVRSLKTTFGPSYLAKIMGELAKLHCLSGILR